MSRRQARGDPGRPLLFSRVSPGSWEKYQELFTAAREHAGAEKFFWTDTGQY